MSIDFSEKLKLIRNSLGFSQDKFAQLIGISLSSIKRIEGGGDITFSSLSKITTHENLKQYSLWLVSDITNPAAGQVAPGEELPEEKIKKLKLSQEDFEQRFAKTVADSLLMFCHLGWFVPNPEKVDFDDCGKLVLKDVRTLIENRYQQDTDKLSKFKSA